MTPLWTTLISRRVTSFFKKRFNAPFFKTEALKERFAIRLQIYDVEETEFFFVVSVFDTQSFLRVIRSVVRTLQAELQR